MKIGSTPLAIGLAAAMSFAPAAFGADADSADAMFDIATPDFAKMVASSNAFEIRSSELARDKATSEDVKAFAAGMITDHTKAGKELMAALDQMAPPAGDPLSPKHAAMIALLEGARDADFERLYIDMQAGAHMEAVSLFRTFSKSGDDVEVVAFAKAALPVLERHETHIMEIVATH